VLHHRRHDVSCLLQITTLLLWRRYGRHSSQTQLHGRLLSQTQQYCRYSNSIGDIFHKHSIAFKRYFKQFTEIGAMGVVTWGLKAPRTVI
jgi:hypothetical protein